MRYFPLIKRIYVEFIVFGSEHFFVGIKIKKKHGKQSNSMDKTGPRRWSTCEKGTPTLWK